MYRRSLAFAVVSTLVLSAAGCSSTLSPGTGPLSASQGGDNPPGDNPGLRASDDTIPYHWGGADDPANHDVGDDHGGDGVGVSDDGPNHQ